MDKVRLYQILSVLLIPYREPGFLVPEKDVIAEAGYSFRMLQKREMMTVSQREKWEKRYNRSENSLRSFLKEHSEWNIRKLDDFRLLLNLFFPDSKVASLFDEKCQQDVHIEINQLYLQNLYEIAKSLLTFRDGRTAIRTWINEFDEKDIFRYPYVFDKVEIWNLLSRMVAVDVYIAAFFIETGISDVFYLDGQSNCILLADKTLEKVLKKGISETHLHFNAGADFAYLWQELMDLRNWENSLKNEKMYQEYCGKKKISFLIPLYRLVWAEYLEKGDDISFETFLLQEYSEYGTAIISALCYMLKGELKRYVGELSKLYHFFAYKWKNWYEPVEDEFLFFTVYRKYKKYKTHSELIFLFRSLLYFKKHREASAELHLFFQYIRVKNIYYKDFVQSNQIEGLDNFSQFYKEMSDRFGREMNLRKRYDVVFKSIAHNTYLQKLEIRIAPKIIDKYPNARYYDFENVKREIKRIYLKQVKDVLVVYRRYIVESAGVCYEDYERECRDVQVERVNEQRIGQILDDMFVEGKIALPTLGIIYHFIKRDFIDNRIGDTCWIQTKEEIISYSRHIRVWREAMVKSAQILEELRAEIPYFGEYVVGIDAASIENSTEPWIFAPLYAGIRNRKVTRPVLKDELGNIRKINNIGFTYHVGEEYRHLLSGFRHIDEVIEHFHYKAGDRLGHAIALGTDVAQWVEENEVIVIPILEHMENLIWLWGNLIYSNWEIDTNAEALEGQILDLAKSIYGNINGLTVHILHEAYISKFKLNYERIFERLRKELNTTEDLENCQEDGWNHFCRFYNVRQPQGLFWTVDKVFCTYFCPLFIRRFMKPILVHVDRKKKSIYEKVQNYLICKVEQTGIYVETNPTSNLAIGDTKMLFSPHILNLNSKGLVCDDQVKHEVLVTVNSDDPIIFNTNSENELSYVYHALTYQGYKKESVLSWIDKVRRMGMDSSFVKSVKKPSVQLMEITKLLHNIDEIVEL